MILLHTLFFVWCVCVCVCVCFVFVIVVLVADLKGSVFLLTGARIKIGFQVQFFCLFPHIAIEDASGNPSFCHLFEFSFSFVDEGWLEAVKIWSDTDCHDPISQRRFATICQMYRLCTVRCCLSVLLLLARSWYSSGNVVSVFVDVGGGIDFLFSVR